MGQPMSSSYENRWLSAGDETKKGSPLVHSRKSITPEDKAPIPAKEKKDKTPVPAKEKKVKENTRPINPNAPPKKAQKDMTKAERRAIQEKQRQEKQAATKQTTDSDKKPSAASAAPTAADSEAAKRKKKPSTKDQNQVPWLLHLEVPKTSEALTKDLHPAVLQLGLYFSEHKIVGSNARCVAMLEIFSKVSFYNCLCVYVCNLIIQEIGHFRSQTSFRCYFL